MDAAMVVPLAHAGHVIEGIAFAGPAIALPLGLAVMALRERRRARRQQPHEPGGRGVPSA